MTTTTDAQALVRDAKAALARTRPHIDSLTLDVYVNDNGQAVLTIDADPTTQGHRRAYIALDALKAKGIAAADPDSGWTANVDRLIANGEPVELYRA